MSEEVYLLEVGVDIPQLVAFARARGIRPQAEDDLGYTVHAWLRAAFGDLAPKPWRLWTSRSRMGRLLGYTRSEAADLRRRLEEFAEPGAAAVVPHARLHLQTRVMPRWRPGRRLGFELQACPVLRRAADGVERDVFLAALDRQPPGTSVSRPHVYCEWAAAQFAQSGAVTVEVLALRGFRLVRQLRHTQRGAEPAAARTPRSFIRPQAIFDGQLRIADPDAFHALLLRGIGRHRAFGYGMLLLRPTP